MLAVAFASGCGGTPNTPNGPYVGSPGNPGSPPPRLVAVNVTVTVPIARNGIGPDYISYNTESLAIQLVSVNGNGVTGINPAVLNTLPASHDCKSQARELVCSAVAKGSPGDDVFAVTAYEGTNATGAVLAVGTAQAKIGSGGGKLSIDNGTLTLGGVIASLKLSLTPNQAKRGAKTTAQVSLTAYDASGAEIEGPSYYAEPVTLAIEGDVDHSFGLHHGARSGQTLLLARPAGGITLTYDGNKQAEPITVQASVGGPSSISVDAGFDLTGKQPPPPVGTIYALNFGANTGKGAVVTEYDGKAKGNAAPERTLNLDPKLYAVSIAVDSSNDLYVGYFDNDLGYDPANGEPDAGNIIAVYAPGASGNDQPTATLEEGAQSTTIFPIFMVFDSSDRLVTYGATAVDGNGGDAVMTYAKGANGKVAPEYAFSFSSPVIHYAGPTGLTLDRAGNFYLNGSFKTGFGNDYGMYVNAAANIGLAYAAPSRYIPWDPKTELDTSYVSNVALDKSGEVLIGKIAPSGSGSGATCQAETNVYDPGAGGGETDKKPLRTLVLDGVATQGTQCTNQADPRYFYFPTISIYGTSLFVGDAYNNAINAFSASGSGAVKPFLQIAGSATQLDAPVALAITSVSEGAKARSVTGVRAGRLPLKHTTLNKGTPST
jgi:hypothetical protein